MSCTNCGSTVSCNNWDAKVETQSVYRRSNYGEVPSRTAHVVDDRDDVAVYRKLASERFERLRTYLAESNKIDAIFKE